MTSLFTARYPAVYTTLNTVFNWDATLYPDKDTEVRGRQLRAFILTFSWTLPAANKLEWKAINLEVSKVYPSDFTATGVCVLSGCEYFIDPDIDRSNPDYRYIRMSTTLEIDILKHRLFMMHECMPRTMSIMLCLQKYVYYNIMQTSTTHQKNSKSPCRIIIAQLGYFTAIITVIS